MNWQSERKSKSNYSEREWCKSYALEDDATTGSSSDYSTESSKDSEDSDNSIGSSQMRIANRKSRQSLSEVPIQKKNDTRSAVSISPKKKSSLNDYAYNDSSCEENPSRENDEDLRQTLAPKKVSTVPPHSNTKPGFDHGSNETLENNEAEFKAKKPSRITRRRTVDHSMKEEEGHNVERRKSLDPAILCSGSQALKIAQEQAEMRKKELVEFQARLAAMQKQAKADSIHLIKTTELNNLDRAEAAASLKEMSAQKERWNNGLKNPEALKVLIENEIKKGKSLPKKVFSASYDLRKAKREERLERMRERLRQQEKEKEVKELEERTAKMLAACAEKEKYNSEAARRKRMHDWYVRQGLPNRDKLRKNIANLPRSEGLTEPDVDLLPWNSEGNFLIVSEVNRILFPDLIRRKKKTNDNYSCSCSDSDSDAKKEAYDSDSENDA